MSTFEYTAIDTNNAIFRGQLSGWSKRGVMHELQRQRLTIVTLKKVQRWTLQLSFLRRVSSLDRIIFTRSLLTMISAGLNISEALASGREQASNPTMQKAITNIEQRIQAGQSLASCLSAYPAVFPPEYVAMISVGERSGKLVEVLHFLSDKLERDYQLRRKIRNAMVYPILILCFMVIMVTVMMVFVIPRIASVYDDARVPLPIYTRILVATSNFVSHNFWAIASTVFVAIILFDLGMSRWTAMRRDVHKTILRLPAIGLIVKKVNLIIIGRTLSMLLKAGLTIDEALKLSASTIRNMVYRDMLLASEPFVARGVRLTDLFNGSPELFPSVFRRMVTTGEQTGNLDTMLSNVAQYYHEDIDHWSTNFTSIIEPILIVGVGVIVGGIAVAILFPLWNFVNVI